MKQYDFKGKNVLITGASTGIGAEFARQLAAKGANLLLVARNEERLNAVAESLRSSTVKVQTVTLDLAELGAAETLRKRVAATHFEVDVLINNAGFGKHARFTQLGPEDLREQILLNVLALSELTHAFLPELERREGGVIQVASTAAFQPVPYLAIYAATKAFVLSFGEALWGEFQHKKFRVLTLCPGATQTPFFERAGEAAALGQKASPAAVVRVGLKAFDQGRPFVIEGSMNRIRAFMGRLVSRRFMIRTSEKLMRPR